MGGKAGDETARRVRGEVARWMEKQPGSWASGQEVR